MKTIKYFIYLLLILTTAYPVSAADVSLNRWVLNITLHGDGKVEDIIQAEIDNAGSIPLDGFSFEVPASGVTVIYDFVHTSSFSGQTLEQQTTPGGTTLTVNFNSSVKPGDKWDGRIGFTALGWAVSEGSGFSIDIPIKAPQAVISGKEMPMSVPSNAEIRGQVFLPPAFEVTSVVPKPFRILFQFDHMVPTWSPDTLHSGDVIHIKSSFSGVLDKIVKTDEKWRELETQINKDKTQGIDVSAAEAHLRNAEDYNTNQALASYWKKDNKAALEFNRYANDELNLTEMSLSAGSPQETAGEKIALGFGAAGLILVLLIYLVVKKHRA